MNVQAVSEHVFIDDLDTRVRVFVCTSKSWNISILPIWNLELKIVVLDGFTTNHLEMFSNWKDVVAFIIRTYGLSPSAESISVREGCVIFFDEISR